MSRNWSLQHSSVSMASDDLTGKLKGNPSKGSLCQLKNQFVKYDEDEKNYEPNSYQRKLS